MKQHNTRVIFPVKETTVKSWFKGQKSKYDNWTHRDYFEGILIVLAVFMALTIVGIVVGA